MRRALATAPRASDEPSAGQAPVDPNLYLMLSAVCRFQSAADEVPDGAGASSPSRRSSRRAGERSKRPSSDWSSMMVPCSCRSSRDAVAEEKESQPARIAAGWAMPHASPRRDSVRSQRVLAMMERRRAARERRATWLRCHGRGKLARAGELAGGRSRPGLGGEGGPTQGSGRSGHLPSGGAR